MKNADPKPVPAKPPKRRTRAILIAVLVAYAAVLAYCATIRPPNLGETSTLAVGIWNWRRGDFEPGREFPPLSRLMAAAPLAVSDAVLEPYRPNDLELIHHSLAYNLLVQNEGRGPEFLKIARWFCIPFALLGAWLCHRWASELYGERAGWLALFAWCVCPNVLARAPLVAPEVPAASLGLLASYAFWRWLKRPSYSRAYLAGLAGGLALLGKFVWLTFHFVWPLLAIAVYFSAAPQRRCRARRMMAHFGLMLLAGWTVVNVAYQFEGFGTPIDAYLGGPVRNARSLHALREGHGLPVPLPGNFVLAIEDRIRAVLRNETWEIRNPYRTSMERAPYDYAYVALYKTPIGFLLAGLALAGNYFWKANLRTAWSPPKRNIQGSDPTASLPHWMAELSLLSPAVAVLSIAAIFPVFNYHLRHVFVAMPFLYIWIAQLARWFTRATWRRAVFLAIIMLSVLASSLVAAPNWLEYANEFTGAPEQTLVGSMDNYNDLRLGPDMIYMPDSLSSKGY